MKHYIIFIICLINHIFPGNLNDWGVNDQVALLTDMSETCIENLETDIYLPFEMGVADADVIIVSDNDLYPNCIITYHSVGVKEGVYLMVVVEFPDHTEGSRNACQDDGSTVMIQEMNKTSIDVCNEVNSMEFGYYSTAIYSTLSSSPNVSVIITSKSLFETVKITVTSARKLNQYEKCDSDSEVPCLVENATVCISRELQCDGNINCGSPTLNDEDVRICDETRYNRLWLVVLCGAIMILIIVLFLIHLLRTCLPSVPDSFFIFNEDEDNKLILSTKYIAAPESLRQTLPRRNLPMDTSSSFKFKNVPIIHEKTGFSSKPLVPYSTIIEKQEDKEKISLSSSSDAEIEIESLNYKSDIKKHMDEVVDNLPIKSDENIPKQNLKKQRFEEANFVNIMDKIDLPTALPKHHQINKSKHSRDLPIHSKHKKAMHQTLDTEHQRKGKKDRSPTFSRQEK